MMAGWSFNFEWWWRIKAHIKGLSHFFSLPRSMSTFIHILTGNTNHHPNYQRWRSTATSFKIDYKRLLAHFWHSHSHSSSSRFVQLARSMFILDLMNKIVCLGRTSLRLESTEICIDWPVRANECNRMFNRLNLIILLQLLLILSINNIIYLYDQ